MSADKGEQSLNELIDDLVSLSDDPEKLADFLNSELHGDDEKEEGAAEKPSETKEPVAAERKEEQKKAEEPQGVAKPEEKETEEKAAEKPEGVLLKDGKTVIPYETLAAARRREAEERKARELAERHLQAAREEMAKLMEELKSLKSKPGLTEEEVRQQKDELQEKINSLKEQVPEVGDPMEAVVEELRRTKTEVAALTMMLQKYQEAQIREIEEKRQEAIDRNPVLRYWQDENVEMFNKAAALDKELRSSTDPAIASLSLDERLSKVVSILETLYGKTELPPKYRQKEGVVSKQADNKDEKGSPEAKAKMRPMTLSDLPGGVAPGDGKNLDEMSPFDIHKVVDGLIDRGATPYDIAHLI